MSVRLCEYDSQSIYECESVSLCVSVSLSVCEWRGVHGGRCTHMGAVGGAEGEANDFWCLASGTGQSPRGDRK